MLSTGGKVVVCQRYAPLSPDMTEIVNMRTQTAEAVTNALLSTPLCPNLSAGKAIQPSSSEHTAMESREPTRPPQLRRLFMNRSLKLLLEPQSYEPF
jgi:hypothetical protein